MASSPLAGLAVVAAQLAACFHPRFDRPACGPGGACPDGLVCNQAGVCESPLPADGAGGEASDGQIDDGQSSGSPCLRRWLDGTVVVAAPQPLVNQSAAGPGERDPWISNDRLRLYYAYAPIGAKNDVYLATRTAASLPFGNGSSIVNLNTNGDDGRPALTADEKTLVLSSNRATGTEFDIYLATRPDTTVSFPGPDTRHLTSVNTAGDQHFDPFLSADALRLYFSSVSIRSPQTQDIYVATRPDLGSDFATPALVRVINSATDADADPAVSLDERILVFTSSRTTGPGGPGGTNVWYATRLDTLHDFGAPQLVPGVNSDANDGDPMLSADGCELYFASTRVGGDYNLYSAQIAP